MVTFVGNSALKTETTDTLWRMRKALYWLFSFTAYGEGKLALFDKIENVNKELTDRIASDSKAPDIPEYLYRNGRVYRLQSVEGATQRYVIEHKWDKAKYKYDRQTYHDDVWQELSLDERYKQIDDALRAVRVSKLAKNKHKF